MELRQHQKDIISIARSQIASGVKRPIIFAPCSFGKTIVAAEISRLAEEKGNKVLFLVHRRLLALQTKEKFDAYGLHSSIIMAGYETDFTAGIMITTVQTYSRRLLLDEPEQNKFFHDAAVIFCDECHLGISKIFQKVYDYYEGKIIIGLTGSPARGDQRGLGEVFDTITKSIGVKELTDRGFLTPVKYFAAECPDVDDVKIVNGDFNSKELETRMNKVKLVGDVVENWLKLGQDRQTIVFATGVKHSISLCNEFLAHGIPTVHLDANSPHNERLDALSAFKSGDVKVITNCQLFTEGYDADFVGCIAIARPTKSLPLWIQMAGRGQRIAEGKDDCLILDFGGNIERHGFLDDEVEWTLDGKELAWSKPNREKKEKKPVKCSFCNLVFHGGNKCPDCGSEVQSFGKKVETVDAELKEINKKKATMADKRRFYGMMLHYVRSKGWKDGAAAHRFRENFGVWPNKMKHVGPIEPDQEFMNYIKYCNIRYAKQQEKIKRGQR